MPNPLMVDLQAGLIANLLMADLQADLMASLLMVDLQAGLMPILPMTGLLADLMASPLMTGLQVSLMAMVEARNTVGLSALLLPSYHTRYRRKLMPLIPLCVQTAID